MGKTIRPASRVTEEQFIAIWAKATSNKYRTSYPDEIRLDAADHGYTDEDDHGLSLSNWRVPLDSLDGIGEYERIFTEDGFHDVNGTTVMLAVGIADDEMGMYVLGYIDENGKPRLYVPAAGNVYDKRCNGPFDYDVVDDDLEFTDAFAEHIFDTANLELMLADAASVLSVNGEPPVPMPKELADMEAARWDNG